MDKCVKAVLAVVAFTIVSPKIKVSGEKNVFQSFDFLFLNKEWLVLRLIIRQHHLYH